MMKFLTFFLVPLLFQTALAIDPDFYRHIEKKEELDRQRERGAQALTQRRKKREKAKLKQAQSYKKTRQSIIRDREKREKLHYKVIERREKREAQKVEQANRFAKKRRKKSDVSWKEGNLEYGIRKPDDKSLKNK